MFEVMSKPLAWKNLSGLWPGRRARRYQGPVTALEVDGQTLRAVTTSGRGVIQRVAAEPLNLAPELDRTDPLEMGRAMAAALSRLHLKPGPVVMGVPRASVLLRALLLPAIENVAETAAMVHLQLSKDLPFRTDEAVIDFGTCRTLAPALPSPEQKGSPAAGVEKAENDRAVAKMEVLAAVVRREVVEYYSRMAAAAGLRLVSLGLVSYANARCVEACHATDGQAGVAIITLRPDEVGIDVVARGSLLFSRGATIKLRPEPGDAMPAAAGTSAPSTDAPGPESGALFQGPSAAGLLPESPASLVEAVCIEVVRSLHSYGSMEAQPPVGKLVVTGGTGQEQAAAEALQTRLGMAAAVLDVAKALHLGAASQDPAAWSISALGLALGAGDEQGLPFDFLHPKKPAAPRDPRLMRLALGASALLAVLLFVFGLRSYLVNQRLKLKTQVAQELIEAKKKRPLYAQMRQQLATIQEWQGGAHNWLEHYAYLSAVLPPSEELYVTSLSISGSGAIRLSVQARSGQVLAKLDKDLRAAGYEVKPLAITPAEEKYGYGFRSMVELEVSPKMKFDLTKLRPPARPVDDASLDGARKGGGP